MPHVDNVVLSYHLVVLTRHFGEGAGLLDVDEFVAARLVCPDELLRDDDQEKLVDVANL